MSATLSKIVAAGRLIIPAKVLRALQLECGGRVVPTADHGHYQRHPADLPSLGRAIRLDFAVYNKI